jgi:hypothetical protein
VTLLPDYLTAPEFTTILTVLQTLPQLISPGGNLIFLFVIKLRTAYTHGRDSNAFSISVGKPEGKRPLGRPGSR